MPRYMRSAKWNFTDAQKRIKATMEWRRDFKPDIIPPDEVRIESETGKMSVFCGRSFQVARLIEEHLQHHQWI